MWFANNLISFSLIYLISSVFLTYSKQQSQAWFLNLPSNGDLGLAFIRIFAGLSFIIHGYNKVVSGPSKWIWMGEQMKNFGFTKGFLFFGLAAVFAEFGGGLALTLGWHTRIYSLLLAFTMFVAWVYHWQKGDSWGPISFPLGLMFVFLGLAVAGSGPWSLDALNKNNISLQFLRDAV